MTGTKKNRQPTARSPHGKAARGWQTPWPSPDVLEPPTVCEEVWSSDRLRCPIGVERPGASTRCVARALPLNTLEPNPTGRVALLSLLNGTAWSFLQDPQAPSPNLPPAPQNRLQIAPGSERINRIANIDIAAPPLCLDVVYIPSYILALESFFLVPKSTFWRIPA